MIKLDASEIAVLSELVARAMVEYATPLPNPGYMKLLSILNKLNKSKD